jgi:hypothetical protein
MPPVGFEPTISAGERPNTYTFGCAATGTGTQHKKREKERERHYTTQLKQII